VSLPAVNIEFSTAARRPTAGAICLAALGLLALLGVVVRYETMASRIAGLEARLAAERTVSAPQLDAANDTPQLQTDAADVTAELATPWSQLMVDLESAGVDSKGAVALLGVEPDRTSGRVKLTAEARSLTAALSYLQRLQASGTLRQPLLDSHEVRADDPEHPVRVQISADWKARS